MVGRLQDSVEKVKLDREMGRQYMTLEELMKDEFKAGKAEGIIEGKAEGIIEGETKGRAEAIIELLSGIAPVSAELKARVMSVSDMETLSRLLKKAAAVQSVGELEAYLDQLDL